MTCPACRADTPPGARFCPSCGQDLQLRGDERRVVTVLFADLVGFTALSEARDPEQVKDLVDRCFERLVADIESFGGRVDKIIGDAVVALFGAPIAHEDDAERAVRAGLRMQETLGRAARELGVGVQMRVGVNTGEVLVGALRAGGDYTAMGDVVNTANRLQAAALPGQVVVGVQTYAATRRVVRYRPLGEVAARGREAAVSAWAAEEALLPPGHRPDRHRVPLVGRDAEISVLSGAVRTTVVHRRASLLLVLGEAGVGKSRLVEELAALAQEQHDALVLEGRCVPYGEANVWWPVAEALRHGCGIRGTAADDEARLLAREAVRAALGDEAPAEEVDRICAGLLHLMGFESPLRGIDQARAREQAAAALVTFTERYMDQRPVVVALSDLHWADDLVLDLLDTLLARLGDRPFVILATARRPLEERWTPPAGRHNLAALTLDPLPHAASAELLCSLAGTDLPDDLAADLLDRSGGNPLFLEELVALLAEGGGTAADGGLGLPADRRRGELPDTLRGLVAARLDGLGADERRVLEDCAVLGRRGPLTAIETMAAHHLGISDVRPLLDALVAKELLELRGAGADQRWAFRSDLVREVAYAMLTKGDRARSHAGIAVWIEHHERLDQEVVIDRIAHHYGRAAELVADVGQVDGVPHDVTDRALTWIERAAQVARDTEVPVVAARLYGEGLALLGRAPGPRRRQFLLGRAASLGSLRDVVAACADAEEALAEARGEQDEPGVAAALLVLGDLAQKEGRWEHAEQLLLDAQHRFVDLGDGAGEARALRLRGFGALFRREFAAATELLEAAHARFDELGDQRGAAWALQNLAWAAFYSGRPHEAESRLRVAAEMFTDTGDRGGLGWALGLLAYTRFLLGHRGEADTMAEEVLGHAERAGDRWAIGMMLVLRAAVRLWEGDPHAAIDLAREAASIFEELDDVFGRLQAGSMLGRALVSAGRVQEGIAQMQALTEVEDDEATLRDKAFYGSALSSAANAIGDAELAAASLDVEPLDADSDRAVDHERVLAAALNLVQRGDARAARERIESLDRLGRRGGNASAVRAVVLAAVGDVAGVHEAAGQVEGDDRSTYLDRVYAGMAMALTLARCADADGAAAAIAATCALADGTGDRVAQAIARLAAATVGARSADAAAGRVGAGAEDLLAELGIAADGWRRAFSLVLDAEVVDSAAS